MKLDYNLLSLKQPKHYEHKDMSIVEMTEIFLSSDFFKKVRQSDEEASVGDSFHVATMLKYLVRMHFKGTLIEDIAKAFSYCVAFFFDVDIDDVFDIDDDELEDVKKYFGAVYEWFDLIYGNVRTYH